MKDYGFVLFDLDGTITDSKVGITKSVQYALKKFNIIENDLNKLEPFIGPPLMDSFKEYYTFNDNMAKDAVTYYREYYSTQGIFENQVYSDIPFLLEYLVENGKKVMVATSKPTYYAVQIIKHFQLNKYFTSIVGSNLDGTRVRKGEVIQVALEGLKERNIAKSDVLMIGDRKHDILGAKENNIDSLAVTYGFGSYEELMEAKPTYLVNDVQEIHEKFIQAK